MAISEELLVKITVDASDAKRSMPVISAGMDKITKAVQSVADSSNTAFKAMGSGLRSTGPALSDFGSKMLTLASTITVVKEGFSALRSVAEGTVNSFLQQDQAQRKLANTLRITGQFSDESYQSLLNFASALQDISTIGDEVSLPLLSLAKSMGVTDEQAKFLVRTTADLAAATGKNLTEAFNMLISQLSGAAGEAVKFIPKLKELKEEELRAGKGIELVAQKFAGFAAGEAQTASGALTQLKNSFGDLLETLGEVVAGSLDLEDSSKTLKGLIEELNREIQASKDTWIAFGQVLTSVASGFVEATKGVVTAINLISARLDLGLGGVVKLREEYRGLTKDINNLIAKNDELAKIIEASKELGPGASQVQRFQAFVKVTNDWGTAAKLSTMSQDDLVRAFEDTAKEIDRLSTQAQKTSNGLIGVKNAVNQTKAAVDRFRSGKFQIDITPKADKAEMAKIEAFMKSISDKSEALRLRAIELNGTELDLVKARGRTEQENLNLLIRRVQLSKDISDKQKSRLIQELKSAKTLAGENSLLEQKKLLERETAALVSERLQLGLRLLELSDDEGAALKDRFDLQRRILDVRKQELEKNKEQYATALQLIDINKGLLDLIQGEEEFNLKVSLLPEFSQELAKQAKRFLIGVNDGIRAINNEFETAFKTIPAKMLNSLALGFGTFFDGFKGAFMVSGKVIGDAIGYAFTDAAGDIDRSFSSMFGESWQKLKDIGNQISSDLATSVEKMQELNPNLQAFLEKLGLLTKEKPPGEIATEPTAEPTWIDEVRGKINDTFSKAVKFFQPVADWFGEKGKEIGAIFEKAWARLDFDKIMKGLGKFLSAWGKTIGYAADTMISAFSALFDPEAIKGLADSMTRIVDELPGLLIRAFSSLTQAFIKFAQKLPEVVTRIMDNMNVLIQRLMDAAPAMIEGLMKGLDNFLDRLTDITGRILDALPDILSSFLRKLPETITKSFNAVGGILAQTIKAFPDILNELLENMPKVVEAFITGLLDSTSMVMEAILDWFLSGGAEKIVVSITRFISLRLPIALVRGIVEGLKKAAGRIFGGFKIPDAIGKLPEQFAEGLRNLAKSATNEASQIFRVLDLKAEARGMDAAQRIQDAVDSATTRLGERFKGLIGALVDAWRGIFNWFTEVFGALIGQAWHAILDFFNNVLGPAVGRAWHAILDFFENILGPILVTIWRGVFDFFTKELPAIFHQVVAGFTELFQKLGGIVSEAWKWVKVHIIDNLTSIGETAFKWVKTNIVDKLTGIGKKAFQWVETNVIDPLTNFKWPTFDNEAFRQLGGKIWDGLKSSFDIEAFRQMGGKIWDGLKSGLLAFDWGSLFSGIKIGGGGGGFNPFGSTGGLVTDSGIRYFAAGGMARGTDTVPAMLTPGEFVLRRGVVDSMGLDNVRQLNRGGGLSGGSTVNNEVSINVDISFDGMPDENFVQTKIIPQIKKELKKASIKGELLVSNRGVF